MPEIASATSGDAIDHFAIVSAPILHLDSARHRPMSPKASVAVEMHTPLLKVRTLDERMLVRSRHPILDGERLCAWIDRRDVLEFAQAPITVGTQIDWTDPVTGRTRTLANPLPLKALLRSNPQSNPHDATVVQIHERPTLTSTVRAEEDVFGIYLIYAEREVDGSFWFWLAGSSPQAPTAFAGWVPAEHVLLWESQMSLSFNDVVKGSAIHASRHTAALQDSSGVLAYHPGDLRYTGPDGNVAIAEGAMDRDGPLMPILFEAPSAGGRGQTVYRVGFLGRSALAVPTETCEMAFGSVGCENAARSGQFMGEGFVRYDERLQNYDFWVNLDYDDLDLISRIMQLTCRGFERSSVRRNIEQAMMLVTSTLGGDQYRPDIPVGEFLRRYIFLPANHFPSILESTPDRIEEQWQRARDADTKAGTLDETLRIADPICRSAELLGLAFDGKRLVDPSTDLVRASSLSDRPGVSYSWTVADNDRVLDFDWERRQRGGENDYFAIPVDYLPARDVSPW